MMRIRAVLFKGEKPSLPLTDLLSLRLILRFYLLHPRSPLSRIIRVIPSRSYPFHVASLLVAPSFLLFHPRYSFSFIFATSSFVPFDLYSRLVPSLLFLPRMPGWPLVLVRLVT